jgi:hypothetical protein
MCRVSLPIRHGSNLGKPRSKSLAASAIAFPGRSLARFWESDGPSEQPAASPATSELEKPWLAENHSERRRRSIAIGDLVYMRNAHGREELYNIEADPDEQNDLAGQGGIRTVWQDFRSSMRRILADDPKSALASDAAIADAEGGQTPPDPTAE